MGKKLTKDEVNERLKNRSIINIDDIRDHEQNATWKCLVCDYRWNAAISNVTRKTYPTGCPMCSKNVPWNNDGIDKSLIGRKIQRIGDCINAHAPLEWKCEVCEYVWNTPLNSVLRKDSPTGCPNCSGSIPLTNTQIDVLLKGRHVQRIGNCKGINTRIKWGCLICYHEWEVPPSGVIGKYQTGCPLCARERKIQRLKDNRKTNESIDNKLIGRPIQRVGEYERNNVKIEWCCLKCKCMWMASPSKILDSKNPTGCIFCFPHFSKPETKWLNSHNIPNDKEHRQVVGLILKNKRYKVDGYIPETNTIYEFWGDYWHGNPTKHDPTKINASTGLTFGELYQKTLKKRQMILDAGYNLIEIWESDFLKPNVKK